MATSPRRWFALFSAVALALVGLVLAASPAQAAGVTRYVSTTGDDTDNDCTDAGNPCATVQNGVNQANDGDTVSVAAGTYDESVRIRKSLTLVGAGTSGANDTVIDGFDGDPSIFIDGFDTNTPPEVTIKDLDVSGDTDAEGILVEFATAHVIGCIVSNNDDDGINVEDQSTVSVASSTVNDNGNNGITLDVSRDLAATHARRLGVLPSVTVDGSVVNGNQDGGVIVETGQADITDTTLDGNVGAGLVLDGAGTLGSLTTSTVSNTVPFSNRDGGDGFGGGGVLTFPGGQVSIDRSTVFGNTGQGVLAFASAVTIDNSTISGTIAPKDGTEVGGPQDLPYGGIAVDNQVPSRTGRALATAGWTGKKARLNAAAAAQDGPETTVTGTIVADNTTLADCNGDVTDGGFNLDSDGSCAWTEDSSITKGNAKLGPLADNGGPTETLLPAKGSDAIDRIPTGSGGCSTTVPDQRGVPRPQGQSNKCDIGAVEADQPPIVITPNKLPHGKVGHAYHAQLSATGGLGAPYEFSLAPSSDPLPDGLTLHANGKINGTPTKAGHFPITVSVDDPTLKNYVIVITAPAPPTTPVVTPPSSGPIANTGTPVASLSMTGVLAIVGGVLLLIAAGWIGARPGRHRIH